jgi:hypothetical protein
LLVRGASEGATNLLVFPFPAMKKETRTHGHIERAFTKAK